MAAYIASPGDIREHYGIEQTVLAGGYGYRQLLELVQNGADAILESPASGHSTVESNRIEVFLAASHLYVANTGAPLNADGIVALLSSHSSPKRANQIGRFGLGFKSLLRLGGQIDLFSIGAAMRFDPERCRQELCDQFNVTNAPGLRLAWVLDEHRERIADPILGRVEWATTIVRAEITDTELFQHLQNEIMEFPSEFLLFLPVPVIVSLDAGAETKRVVRRASEGIDTVLYDGEKVSRWRVFEKAVVVTDERARKDATHIHARDAAVPISWAVPLDSTREEAGRFWAFFPTHTPTRLPGIINAPWKLNSDRNAIIAGEWNNILMLEAAGLVSESLRSLATAEDPARPIDAFPRQLDRQDEDAASLVNALWKQIESSESIPNAKGEFQYPRVLLRHPRDTMELARDWSTAALTGLDTVVHHACLSRERNSRLAELNRRLEKSQLGVSQESPVSNLNRADEVSWFGDVASIEATGAMKVLRLAEAYAGACSNQEWNKLRPTLAIIPTDDGKLLKPDELIIAPEGISIPDRSQIASFLRADPEALRILADVMKVHQLDDTTWRKLLDEALGKIRLQISIFNYSGTARGMETEWRTLWARLRLAPAAIRNQFILDRKNLLRVRRRDGMWVLCNEVLLPGRLVNAQVNEGDNHLILIDEDEHAHDADIVKQIGVVDFPLGIIGPASLDSVVSENKVSLMPWLEGHRRDYAKNVNKRASSAYLDPANLAMPSGWSLLAKLTGTPNALFTTALLSFLKNPQFENPIEFSHSTTPERYPVIKIPHPILWFLLRHGSVLIGESAVPLKTVLARQESAAMTLLPGWPELQPCFVTLAAAAADIPKVTAPEVQAFWTAMFSHLVTVSALADDGLLKLWTGAAVDGVVPEQLPGDAGNITLPNVYVTASADLARRARRPARTVITLDEQTLILWLEKGAQNLDRIFKPAWQEQLGPADYLVSIMPELATVLRPELRNAARCQLVCGLKLCFDDTEEPLPCLMWDNTLHLDAGQLSALSRAERLRQIINEISPAGWLAQGATDALRSVYDTGLETRRAAVARGNSLAERLLLAVGNRAQPLRNALGDLAGMEFILNCPLPKSRGIDACTTGASHS